MLLGLDIYLTKLDKKNKWSAPQIVGEPISGDGNEGSCVPTNTSIFFSSKSLIIFSYEFLFLVHNYINVFIS